MKKWRFIVAMEFRKIFAYRSDFWVTFLGQTLLQLLVARALWQNIFESQGQTELNGFTLSTMTLYYLITSVGTKILAGENVGFISREIYDGTFTRYLIYPLSFLEYKTITYLTYSLFYSMHLSLIFLLYHLLFYPDQLTLITLANLTLGTGVFLLAAFAYAMMATLVELMALWAENIWSLMVMLRFLAFFFGGSFIPLDFFPAWALEILKYTPFPYLINLPVKTIMGQMDPIQVLQGAGILLFWIGFFRAAVLLLWKKGQLNYSGAGI
ncbi:MAG TPA: hypothetical protein VNJ01_15360 [Bacteriovoracaceae bacterium]|nr:hypothetical protein [Bacteriovoracaceae bacterium]